MVYVDYDPVVLAHARALLTSSEAGSTEYVDADLRDTPAILSHAAKLLDFTKPVAVTLISLLHAVPELLDDPHAIVARLLDAVPSGSYLVVSHWAADLLGRETKDSLQDIGSRMVQQSLALRNREQVAQFFAGQGPGSTRSRAGGGMSPGARHGRHRQVVSLVRGGLQAVKRR